MAAILKVHARSNRKSDSINRFILEEQSCQISPRSYLKRRSLNFLQTVGRSPLREEQKEEEQEQDD